VNPRLENRRLVIVDDDPTILRTLGAWFRGRNGVRTFQTAEAVMEGIKELDGTHVYIIDYHLPGMQGDELMAWLKGRYPEAKFVAITAQLNWKAIQEGDRNGWDGLLLKPFDPSVLEENILSIL
jgi:two-component system response regulator HydG/two-component system response regulator AtoC